MFMEGILYGVGIGPGDPELLTLKAVRIIDECDIVGIPAKKAENSMAYQIAVNAIPELKEKPVLALPIPMTTDVLRLNQSYEEGCARLIGELEKGKKIALLNLGDPTVYGTYMKFHDRITKAGYRAEVVNGVTSFCAAAGALGISLGSEKENIHILPGCYRAEEIDRYGDTIILMKTGGGLKKVKEQLISLEKENRGTAYAVTNCGMENQQIFRSIGELDEEAGYFTTIIVKKPDSL